MQEIWKDIKGYEGKYQVSNTGKVRSLNYRRWGVVRELKPRIEKTDDGYLSVMLHKNSIGKVFKIHRLVAQAFIPNPNNYPEVNHIDENKQNNNVLNLEWCDHKYNNNYGTKPRRIGQKNSKPIIQCSLDGSEIREWESMRAAKTELGIFNITQALKGRYKQAGGFVWKYK